MNLSTNFTLSEFTHSQEADRAGLDNIPSAEIIGNLIVVAKNFEIVRATLMAPILISSGYRAPLVNRLIGSDDNSDHPKGWCGDFTAPRFGTPYQICRRLVESGIKFDQLIFEMSWVHLSFAPRMRQQVMTKFYKRPYFKGLIEVPA